MSGSSWIPLVASLVAVWFAIDLGRQYAVRGKWYQLWWAVSMLSYACASFGEWYALSFGWNVSMYKFYYFNAVSLVGLMGAGEVYMLFQKRKWVGHVYTLLTVIGIVWFAVLLGQASPIASALARHDAAIGGGALASGSVIRTVFPPLLSGIGGLLLIVGPLFSWWKSRFRGNLFIAGGALILSAAGRMAVLGYPELLPVAELAGIVLIFYGVIGTGQRQSQSVQVAVAEESGGR